MKIELACTTEVLIIEIKDKRFKRKDIAKTYALALKSSWPTDWARVNQAIMERWSISGLEFIKELAWSGKAFEATPAIPLPTPGEGGKC